MSMPARPWLHVAAAALVAVAVVAGLALRLRDPLSDGVVPAEDPYTHMALVRGHLHDGSLDPLNERADLYPPGLHAIVATWWVATGVDLDVAFLVGPAVLGAVGILGVALLLWRNAGAAAAIVGAAAMAVLPEAVFRTSMMAPTALDLAVLPFLLLALLELMQGRLAWTAPAAALAAILLFAHPWIFAIVAPAAAALVVVALVAPWPRGAGAPLSVRGVALAALLLGTGLTLALSGCAGVCGPGFRNVVPDLQRYADVAPVALAGLAIVAAVLLAAARPLQRLLDRLHDTPRPSVARAVVATLLVVGVVALAVPAHVQGLPHQVDLVAMVGVPTLALAAAGLAAFALRPTPAAAAGAALALTTLPFTLYDAFGSPFWPHRTAVYLALGLALLAGSAGAMLADFLHGAWQALRRVRPQAAGRRVAFASVAPLLAVSAVSAAVVAQTPGYEDGWYRLYGACETGALADVGAMLEEDPELLVVAGSWQAKLVVAAHADEPARVWYSPTYYADPGNRRGLADRTIVAVDEPHLDRGAGSASFLDDAGWEPIGSWCTGPEGPTVRAAIHRAGGPA